MAVERSGGRSAVRSLAESGSARLRLPRTEGAPEGVIINTGGGIAAGDRVHISATLGPDAELVLTTAAAEKIYRAVDGEAAEILTSLTLGSGARLHWLPQETIVFNRAHLRRELEVNLDPSACALLFEAVVFGRAAHGESMRRGSFKDRWRVRRGGRLVYADMLRFEGDLAAVLRNPAVANGHRALATLVYVAPDAEARLEEARVYLRAASSECGASAWDGLLAVRWLAADIATLRGDASDFMTAFRGGPLPRVWQV